MYFFHNLPWLRGKIYQKLQLPKGKLRIFKIDGITIFIDLAEREREREWEREREKH